MRLSIESLNRFSTLTHVWKPGMSETVFSPFLPHLSTSGKCRERMVLHRRQCKPFHRKKTILVIEKPARAW